MSKTKPIDNMATGNGSERLDQYFEANEIKDSEKRRAILLSVCGSKTYGLVRNLLQPKRPGEAEIKEIYAALERHFSQEPSVSRQEVESVAEFVDGLRRLSEHCKFGTALEDMLCGRLVCGINDDHIQRRLLAEREFSFEKALEIALSHEMASKNLIDLGRKTTGSVNKVKESTKPRSEGKKLECLRCGGNHDPRRCVFENETKGTLWRKFAQIRRNPEDKNEAGADKQYNQIENRPPPNTNRKHTLFKTAKMCMLCIICRVYKRKPSKVEIELGGSKTMMEIDNGASKTILSETPYGRLCDALGPLRETKKVLSTFTGEQIPMIGET